MFLLLHKREVKPDYCCDILGHEVSPGGNLVALINQLVNYLLYISCFWLIFFFVTLQLKISPIVTAHHYT